MLTEGKIWVANTKNGQRITLAPKMANRHGLVAGATGTGKTVTLKVLAEGFSDMGVPVFMADVKGDVAGMLAPGQDSENMQQRIQKFGLAEAGFQYQGYPVTIWDLFGTKGIPLRSTISEIGPMLLARILNLNDLQTDVLSIVFKIADDNSLLLIDTKDLKSMLNYIGEHQAELAPSYGKISPATIGAITRAVVALEVSGGEEFFQEPNLQIQDWLTLGAGGKGMINILDSSSLMSQPKLYSTFLLWLLSELFETLPEVGDLDKPKMVFFFDEAHLLFQDTPKVLEDKIEQMVKLIRSKGVGVYFCTQNPRDIPDGVLAQLGNKIQHGLRAFTPAEQKAVRAVADSFRENPEFNTLETILNLGTGEAVVSFLDEKGIPGVSELVDILPPQCRMAAATDAERDQAIKGSLLYSKYLNAVDNQSAYEVLEQQAVAEAKAIEEAKTKAAQEKEAAKKQAAEEKEAQKAKAKQDRQRQQAVQSVGNSIMGTVGREVGKSVGSKFGSFGKTLGGNVGASLGRGLLKTLKK